MDSTGPEPHVISWDATMKQHVCSCGWSTDNAAMALIHSALKEHLQAKETRNG